MNNGNEPAYMRQLSELCRKGRLPAEAGVHHIDIYHDDWCASFRGGACDCEPEIKIRAWPRHIGRIGRA